MVKFIGADKSGNANDTFRSPGLQPQTLNQSSQSVQFASQQQQQLGESLKGSLQFQAQTAQRISEDSQRTNASLAESRSREVQASAQSGQGFQQALGNLANVGQMIVQTLDNRSKQEAAQAKAVRERNAATMWDRVSQWEVDAPAKARLDPAGTVKLRGEVADMFNSTEGADLLPEDRQALMKHTYGNVIAGLSSKNVEDLMTQQRKLQEVNDNLAVSRAQLESTSLIASLANSNSQEEQGVAAQKLSEFAGKISLNGDFNPMRKAEMLLGLTTAMGKAMYSSEENQYKARELVVQFNAFQSDVAQARQQYPNDVESQNAAIAYSAFRNKIPTSISDNYDLVKAQERAIHRVELGNKERGLRNDEVARSLGVAGTDDEAGYDAELFNTEASLQVFATQLGNGDAKVGMETPRYKQVVAAQKALKEFQTLQVETNGKYAQLQQQKARIAQGDANTNLEYMRTLKPSPQTDDLIKRLQIASGNNPALASMLPLIGQYEQLDAQRKAAFDSAYAQATAQGFNASAELTSAIDMEARAVQQKLSLSQRELVRYGYGIDGKYDPHKAKDIEQRRIQAEAKRQADWSAQQAATGSQGGTTDTAPFNQGGYFNGLEVFQEQQGLVMPITKTALKKQGAANIGDAVGYSEWRGRQHNGQDIGVDLRTPINAQMDGKVVDMWNDGEGGSSGNTVKVKYADGSTHVFMHLYERPNLAVGQRVRAGQVIGKVGNTGLAGGNSNAGNSHLHWEVWYGEQRSTPQEWSSKYRQSQQGRPSQPRPGGPGASITAPVRGVQGVPIKGGVLVPNGKGGASRVAYNSPQMNVQQVKQQYDVPSPVSVDKTRAGQVLVQRTGKKGVNGLEDLVATVYDKNGEIAGTYLVNSGSPSMQGTFGAMGTTIAGSNAPLEYGQYSIGVGEDATDIPGMRSQFIPIEPKGITQRSLLGIHFDGDRDVKPGSAGCIVFVTKDSFDAFHANIKRNQNRTLTFDSKIRDSGQQKQRPSHTLPPANTGGRIFHGPGGTRFQRDINGNMVALPKVVGDSGQGVTTSSANYNNASPLRTLTNSNRASDYNINDLTNTHGFAPLKRNPSAARAVNEVAKSFGVPGEWLAEIISVETGNTFDPNQKEYGGSGATGLIQFFPDHDGGSTKTINGKVYQLADIGRMTMEQQLRGPVTDYIKEAMRSNGMKKIPTIQDMYSLIWAYGPASKARSMRDMRGPSGVEVLNRLGKFSGRRYSSLQQTPATNIAQDDAYTSERSSKLIKRIDRNYHASCGTCNLMASNSMFVPHERVSLNSGAELFNLA